LYFGTSESGDNKERKESRYDGNGREKDGKYNSKSPGINILIEKDNTSLGTDNDDCYNRIKKINAAIEDESAPLLYVINTSWTWAKSSSLSNSSDEPTDVTKDKNTGILRIEQSSNEYVAVPGLSVLTEGPMVNNNYFTLGPITLTGFKGQMIAIVGSVAAGKSTFLLGCLGEVLEDRGEVQELADMERTTLPLGRELVRGEIGRVVRDNEDIRKGNKNEIQCSDKTAYISGSISYCQQVPAMHANISVRENILMGAVFDLQRYTEVFTDCCLLEDAKSWEGGDLLLVTPSSSNLSGGQRLRIGIARAFYALSRTVLLDDPFSALDANTSAEIMKFIELEKKNRLIVFTTHSLKLLASSSATIITLKGGKQISSPSHEEQSLLAAEVGADVVDKFGDRDHNENILIDNDKNTPTYCESNDVDTFKSSEYNSDNISFEDPKYNENDNNCQNIHNSRVFSTNNEIIKKNKNEKNEIKSDDSHQLEQMKSGHINKSIFKIYLQATGPYLTVIVMLSTIIMQGSSNSMAYWLACWSNSSQDIADSESILSNNIISKFQDFFRNISSEKFLQVAAVIILVNIIAAVLRSSLFALGGLTAAKTLYSRLSYSVLNADILFFESVSVGQIINRWVQTCNCN
jgi:ABC-type multidrug transport system ATPase subunit